MKFAVTLLLFISAFSLSAASSLSVKVSCKEADGLFRISQTFEIETEDGENSLLFEALIYEGSRLSNFDVRHFNFQINREEGKFILEVEPKRTGIQTMVVTYEVTMGKNGEIPLLYAHFPTKSATENFFELSFKSMKDYQILFPAVPTTAVESQDAIQQELILVESPSMIRIRDSAHSKGIDLILTIDILVIFLFLVISWLIWRFRKRFMYG